MSFKWRVGSLGFAGALLLSHALQAQLAPSPGEMVSGDVTPGTPLVQGQGIKLSDDNTTRLHLNLGLAAGYNTNPYSMTLGYPSPLNKGDLEFKISPEIFVASAGSKLYFELGAKANVNLLPGAFNGGGNANYQLFDFAGHAVAQLNKGGHISVLVRDDVNATRAPGEIFVTDSLNMANTINVGVIGRPGGGAVSLELDGQFGQSVWPDGTTNLQLDTTNMYGRARLDWKLLPQTNFFLEARGGSYALVGQAPYTVNPFWGNVGATSQITNTMSLTASAGYANPFLQNTSTNVLVSQGYMGFVGNLNASWMLGKDSFVVAGIMRDMIPVPVFFDVAANSAFVELDYKFGKKVALKCNLMGSWIQMDSPAALLPGGAEAGNPPRSDISLDNTINLDYYIRDWFSIGLENHLSTRWSNSSVLELTGNQGLYASSGVNNYNFLFWRDEVLFVMNLHY